ncbi:MAG: glycosyl hydrolase [Ignavibacteriales bacterium]|nr:glycosyl hydrolase [Ignavibacteriales bacterium]
MKYLLLIFLLFTSLSISSEKNDTLKSSTFGGLKFRSLGPAIIGGRIIAFAVHPQNRSTYYVAVASGGVWKTTNSGTTFDCVFENENSFSIGAVALNPSNLHEVWIGTGELNSQRSVSYGDGIYKSEDDGKSWKNMGLKTSEHISDIEFDSRNTKIMYVASQGPLWKEGGERGLFKSTDGGTTWKNILHTSDNTGVHDVVLDPRNQDVIYATTYQRRRHFWSMIDGGPEGSIQKSTDAGMTWNKLGGGLPGGDLGKIGIDISPVNPDVLFAFVEAQADGGGIFRTTDRGATWEKRNSQIDVPMYYGKIFCDQKNVDRIVASGTIMYYSDDAGKTLKRIGEKSVHIDYHAIWIDPNDTDYMLLGTDGGLYESHDGNKTWRFINNLPTIQFYRVAVDNAEPFYNVYGGTQDNATLGGPSQTISKYGILNSDWFVTIGGDGFESQIDPNDPNIVYSQYQYGGLARFDKKTGEVLWIQPMEEKGEDGLRWNWDAPLLISPHSSSRIYFGANKLFRSDDRGNSWKTISGDLSRQMDRNKIPMMGKLWSVDAINRHGNTAAWGNLSQVSESPKKENLIYVGTDDGLIQLKDGEASEWKKIEKISGIPELAYVTVVSASQHDENIVYAAFDNHQQGDFRPYLLKSADKGKSWKMISNNLPENGSVKSFAEDHLDANLIFAGTEYGIFFSYNGGKIWTQLKSGLPTIPVKDIAIQKRENDLVLATFGRGFYVLDNYSPLRTANPELLEKEAHIFPIKDALMFHQSDPLTGDDQGWQGDNFYHASNPAFGATIYYSIKDDWKSKKQNRKDEEKEAEKKKSEIKIPSYDESRNEVDEEAKTIMFTIRDESGNIVRKLKGENSSGINRLVWDLRFPSIEPVNSSSSDDGKNSGWFAMPGKYSITLSKRVDGVETQIAGPVEFICKALGTPSIPTKDRSALIAFQQKSAKLQRVVSASMNILRETRSKITAIKASLMQTPSVTSETQEKIRSIDMRLKTMSRKFNGDEIISRRNDAAPPSISSRINKLTESFYSSNADITDVQRKAYQIATDEFEIEYASLRKIVEEEIPSIEKEIDKLGAPPIPGRLPEWKRE